MSTATSSSSSSSPLSSIENTQIVVLLPQEGFDPSETAVPYHILSQKPFGCNFTFAVPNPAIKAECDPIMITGEGLGFLLKESMRADENGRSSYAALSASKLLLPPNTISYDDALSSVDKYEALLLPGGHCPNMIPYLESKTCQKIISAFDATQKPIAAVCHGVVLAARAGILKQKRATSLEWWQESLAHNLTRLWMGNYYKTYADRTVESEVTAACKEFCVGPKGLKSFSRDSVQDRSGFCIRDGNLLTARWPGDIHTFSFEFAKLIAETKSKSKTIVTSAVQSEKTESS